MTPDSFIISKITGEITTRRVSPKIKIHTLSPERTRGSAPVRHRSGDTGTGVAVEDTRRLRDRPA